MWSTRGVRAWHEGWWEIGRETGNLLAPMLGVRQEHDLDAPERDGRAGDHRLVLHLRRAAAQDRHERAGVPVEPLPVRGLPPLRRRDRLRAVRGSDAPRPAAVSRRDRRARRCWCRCRWCCSRARASPTPAPSIEKAHRVGAHVILDVYQGAGTVPMDLEALGGGLRRRGLGEVVVRRARRGLSLRPPRSRGDARARARRLGRSRRRRSSSPPGPSATPAAPSASRAARRTCRRSIRRGPATRSSPRSACRRSASGRCALTRKSDRRRPGRRLSARTRRPAITSAAGRSSSTCRTAPRSPTN